MSWVDPEQLARDWHWSDDAPVHTVSVDDDDYPDPLIACGHWVGITLSDGRSLQCDDSNAYLAFDPESPEGGGRLYLVLPASVRRVAQSLWQDGARTTTLRRLARSVGGTHVDGYPDVEVQPLGPIVQVEYYARKCGHGQGADDGATFYHDHESPLPWLAVSEDGRLWYCGGEYDATDNRGICG